MIQIKRVFFNHFKRNEGFNRYFVKEALNKTAPSSKDQKLFN